MSEPTLDQLDRICDAIFGPVSGVEVYDIYSSDVCNHTISGTIDGVHQFVVESGNHRGTCVLEWGPIGSISKWHPPEPDPLTLLFRPALFDLGTDLENRIRCLWKIYLNWRSQEWFKVAVAALNYDTRYSPGLVIHRHYQRLATSKGLVISHESEFREILARMGQ